MQTLSLDQIRSNAPQAFATAPKAGLSQKYSFLPTSRIIEDMDRLGWFVSEAKANKYRNTDSQEHGTHLVRFYNPEIFIKDAEGQIEAYPELVILNSSNGRGSFRAEMGIIRMACDNGMIIKDKDFGGFKLRHAGYSFEQLQETLNQFIEQLPNIVGKINNFSNIIMSTEAQTKFAQDAWKLRAGEERLLSALDLEEFLAPRRRQDEGDNLWVVLNRIQEGVMRGGFSATNTKNKLRRVKGLKNIARGVETNMSLWALAEEYATA